MRAYQLALTLWVIVGIFFIGVLIPTSLYIRVYEEATNYAPQHYDSNDNFGWTVNALFSATFWTAAATIAIACFTYMLKLSTDRLAKATDENIRLTQQSIELARDEFISAQRPKIVIRQIAVWQRSTFQKNVLEGGIRSFRCQRGALRPCRFGQYRRHYSYCRVYL